MYRYGSSRKVTCASSNRAAELTRAERHSF